MPWSTWREKTWRNYGRSRSFGGAVCSVNRREGRKQMFIEVGVKAQWDMGVARRIALLPLELYPKAHSAMCLFIAKSDLSTPGLGSDPCQARGPSKHVTMADSWQCCLRPQTTTCLRHSAIFPNFHKYQNEDQLHSPQSLTPPTSHLRIFCHPPLACSRLAWSSCRHAPRVEHQSPPRQLSIHPLPALPVLNPPAAALCNFMKPDHWAPAQKRDAR